MSGFLTPYSVCTVMKGSLLSRHDKEGVGATSALDSYVETFAFFGLPWCTRISASRVCTDSGNPTLVLVRTKSHVVVSISRAP